MWRNSRASDPVSFHWKTKCGYVVSNLLQNLCHILHWRKSRDVCYQESFGYMKDASANTACKRLGACFLVQFFLQVQTSMSRGRNGRHEAGQSNCWSESCGRYDFIVGCVAGKSSGLSNSNCSWGRLKKAVGGSPCTAKTSSWNQNATWQLQVGIRTPHDDVSKGTK